jgi:hypothetical protein
MEREILRNLMAKDTYNREEPDFVKNLRKQNQGLPESYQKQEIRAYNPFQKP